MKGEGEGRGGGGGGAGGGGCGGEMMIQVWGGGEKRGEAEGCEISAYHNSLYNCRSNFWIIAMFQVWGGEREEDDVVTWKFTP